VRGRGRSPPQSACRFKIAAVRRPRYHRPNRPTLNGTLSYPRHAGLRERKSRCRRVM